LNKWVFKISLAILLMIGLTGTFWGSQIVDAAAVRWDSCRKNNGYCYYPGACRDYTDSNRDSICDRSQTNPEKATTPRTSTASAGTVATVASTTAAVIPSSGNSNAYFMIPILLVLAAVYSLTWILAIRKKITLASHRKIWNTALLIFGLVSMLLGIFLVVRIETGFDLTLPFDMLFWHVEAGIAMSLVGIFHILWHWKYFARLFSNPQRGKNGE
jgi:hypothetical protein